MAAFGRWKAQRLARADCSRRGALDERAAGVVRLLNGRAPFCTTSSCSGRLVLAEGGAAESAGVPAAIPKKRCRWLLVAHEPCGRADVVRRGAALAAGLRRPGRAGASRALVRNERHRWALKRAPPMSGPVASGEAGRLPCGRGPLPLLAGRGAAQPGALARGRGAR